MIDQYLSEFTQLPVSWGSIFNDPTGTFWCRIKQKNSMCYRPAGDLGQNPRYAWEHLINCGISVNDFMDVMKNVHVGAYNECLKVSRPDPYPQPPITQWKDLVEFKEFLKGLANLSIGTNLPIWANTSSVTDLNFHFGFNSTIQSDLVGWFFHYYNQQSLNFSRKIWQVLQQNKPHSDTLLTVIDLSKFSPLFQGDYFGQKNSPFPVVFEKPKPPTDIPSPKTQLRGDVSWELSAVSLLVPGIVKPSDSLTFKKDTIKGVFQDPKINDFLRKIPHLLPDGATLYDLLYNSSEPLKWLKPLVDLVAAAEQLLFMEPTFEVRDPKKLIKEDFASWKNTFPFKELVMYDPKMSEENREPSWLALAETIETSDLLRWTNRRMTRLSTGQTHQLFEELMEIIETNFTIREEVWKILTRNKPNLPDFDNIVDQIFPPVRADGKRIKLLKERKEGDAWSASDFLKELKIKNEKLENEFTHFEDNPKKFFGMVKGRKEWIAEIKSYGSTLFEACRIVDELEVLGFIE